MNVNKLLFDLEMPGLRSIFKPYQIEAMEVIWDTGGLWTTAEVWKRVNKRMKPETVSRASIINFLAKMEEEGYLSYDEATGKGGYHRRYAAMHSAEVFKEVMSDRIIEHVRVCFGRPE